jgi:hypothetical protein
LSTNTKALFDGLYTMVNFLSGETANMPACGTLPERFTRAEDNTSLAASTIFNTGTPPPPVAGDKGLEMKALKVRPLLGVVEVLGAVYPQDTRSTPTPRSTANAIALFKPGTPSA